MASSSSSKRGQSYSSGRLTQFVSPSTPATSSFELGRPSRPTSIVPAAFSRPRRSSDLPPANLGPTTPESSTDVQPPLPTRPCEICEEHKDTSFCVQCDTNFCDACWNKQVQHKNGKVGIDGVPHQKTDPTVVNRLKQTFAPPSDPQVQRQLHENDEESAWFGIERDLENMPVFQDYGRFATLMANGALGSQSTRYPQLVSFIGQTGAGKSTVVKMLIEQQFSKAGRESSQYFPRPVVGSVRNDNTPTSGDVHLYADPSTFNGVRPLLYADCEGLEGGETVPIGNRHREEDYMNSTSSKKKTESGDDRKRLTKKLKITRGTQREISWANSPETQKRQYAVTELYPRLLYTFSDVIVFVLQNAKTFESSVLSKLIDWAHSSMEKSINQPALPHAIIALNATDMGVAESEWEVNSATARLMSSIAAALSRDSKYQQYANYFSQRGKIIRTTEDLLLCYYSSIRVVRIPTKGHYMLIDQQVSKLHEEITRGCNTSYVAKRNNRMLSSADELNVYLQCAFDHFAHNLDRPFNFIEVAFKNNPIPQDFGGSILKLAVAMKATGLYINAPSLFRELSHMVASCIMLDCARHDLLGTIEHLLNTYYIDFCDYALEDYCAMFCQCTFTNGKDRCVNVQDGHIKGHQNERGRIIGVGGYVSNFTFLSFQDQWLELLQKATKKLQEILQTKMLSDSRVSEKALASEIHRENMIAFYRKLGGAEQFISHAACFCCLREPPANPLPCGHVLCSPCIYAYGKKAGHAMFSMETCPLHTNTHAFERPWIVKFKPPLAGVRILTLDGGGIRGIVELEVLRALQSAIGVKIPIHQFFDLIVGTSTGGIITLGLGVQHWSVDDCADKFMKLVDQAFSPRLPGLRIGSKYKTQPLVDGLQNVFPKDEPLFGGHHENATGYHTKVAVTATTETGDQSVVLTNYNRPPEDHQEWGFVRPDNPSYELKLWEVGRATSAAPTFFKPFKNDRTNEGYLDGALFYNNPVKIAHRESKLIWPEIADLPPDILLSIGTGHNGRRTPGKADGFVRRSRLAKPVHRGGTIEDIIDGKQSKDRLRGAGRWLQNTPIGHYLNVLINRVDNILNAQQIWEHFRNDVMETSSYADQLRYRRINPDLEINPPKMDDKAKASQIQQIAAKTMKKPKYRNKLVNIAYRLIASSFYFERISDAMEMDQGGYEMTGKIRCRFADSSDELRELGKFLQNQQTGRFQPFFRIYEAQRDHEARNKVITPDKIIAMITHAQFHMERVRIHVSEKMGPTTIALGLHHIESSKEQIFPISGFPNRIIENALQKVQSRDNQDTGNMRHRRSTRRSQYVSGNNRASQFNADDKPSHRRTHSAPSSILEDAEFPMSPNDLNDWMARRARHAREARPPSEMPAGPSTDSTPSSERSSFASPSTGSSASLASPPPTGLPSGIHELPTGIDELVDEDERNLQQAIAQSLRELRLN